MIQVAHNELRIIRVMEKIEALKDDGKWGYRQMKKQRGVGGLTKTHWDHLLEEMACSTLSVLFSDRC